MRCPACNAVWLVSGPEEKMSNARRAAVVKRGDERERRDMFASKPAEPGFVKQTLRPPPPDFCGVAARNETSVLFTVDALNDLARRAGSEPSPSLRDSTIEASDDEGMIDLKSLTSSRPKALGASMSPLFSDPPPDAFVADVGDSTAARREPPPHGMAFSKRAAFGGVAAIVAVLLCGVGIATMFKSEEPVARTAASLIPISPIVNALPPPPAPPPVLAPTPAASTDAPVDDDAKSAAASTKGKKRKGKGRGKASATGAKALPNGEAKAAPKAADKCGCKGNFDCVLRCAANGN